MIKKFFTTLLKIIGLIWFAISIIVAITFLATSSSIFPSVGGRIVAAIIYLAIGSIGLLPFRRKKDPRRLPNNSNSTQHINTIVDVSMPATPLVTATTTLPFADEPLIEAMQRSGQKEVDLRKSVTNKHNPQNRNSHQLSEIEKSSPNPILQFFTSIADLFKVKSIKNECNFLRQQLEGAQVIIDRLGLLEPAQLQVEIDNLKNNISQAELDYADILNEIAMLEQEASKKRENLIELDEEILIQSFGLYEPKYKFKQVDEYKTVLDKIRDRQKEMIKSGAAAPTSVSSGWTVNGDRKQGQRMVKDLQKLFLRAFNNECDDVVSNVKYNNLEQSKKRIESSALAISKLGTIIGVSISSKYEQLKIDELILAFEYAQKKQEEKEELKELRAQEKEAAKLEKEIEEARKKLLKEQTHYNNALLQISSQIETATESEKSVLLAKKEEIIRNLEDADKAMKEVDYREANQRAGYVYVISNIGSFGEDVYKIGMTRRLNPIERIDELGDASVPFNFDVHAMIFCDDAPKLEAALHRAFENNKLNWVNSRREFFNVTLDEIKTVVKNNYEKTAEFIEIADAEQYRVSVKMQQSISE